MKRNLLLFVISLSMATIATAQSKKYVLFEHFTQASCGPCATQNPAFEEVRAENLGSTHHIAYHTSWPGTDPMNAINPTEVQTRVTYYQVSGVPSMHMLGKTWEGGPSAVSGSLIAGSASKSSPLRIKASDTRMEDGSHEVSITMLETGDISGDNLNLRVAVVEKLIEYTSPPGSNGERDFPNVFRKMLTASGGQAYTPTGSGTEQSFTFNYTEESAYQPEELYIIAWLQEDVSGIIVNSGSSIDPLWQFINQEETTTVAGDGPHSFNSRYVSDVVTEKIKIEVSSDAPEEWNSSLDVNGVSVMSGDELDLNSNSADVQLTVSPQTKGGIATYTVSITSIDNPEDPISSVSYTVISGITDIILDHGGVATQWNDAYVSGLTDAGNTGFGILPLSSFKEAYDAGYLADVKNIYDNVSWTFPGLQAEEVGVLSQFLDAGGNLFVNGQDVGWDAFENTNNGANTEVRAFYTDYLSATFVNDGSGANSMLNWDNDVIFGDQGSSTIINVYGGVNIYPDVFTPIEPAVALYHYNNNENSTGAIRVEEDGHKIVYVGVDMGMIADETVRHAIIKVSHDWFAGIISSTEYDQLIKEALGQSYPNPTADFTTIPFSNLEKDADIHVTDVSGKVLHTGKVQSGQSSYDLNLSDFTSGTYFYYLKTNEGKSVPQKISVVK